MSIFNNISNILVQEDTNSNDINIENIHTDTDIEKYSFMTETYDFILGYTKEYNNSLKEFYSNIMESGDNQEIITEAFDGFFAKAKEIIKKFLAFIKKIFNKFVTKLHSLFKSEKYLEKNKNEFAKFSSEDEFTIKGYEFTNLYNSDIPKGNAIDAWFNDDDTDNSGYNLSASDINGYDPAKDKADSSQKTIVDKINGKYEALIDKLDDWYDEFRGMVIGQKGYPISSSEYDEELKKVFRDDSTEMTDITIDSTAVSKAYQEFHNYQELVKSIEKTRKEIENNYLKLQKALETSAKKEKTGDGIFFKFSLSTISNSWAHDQMANFSDDDITYEKNRGSGTNKQITNVIYNKIDMYMKAKVTQVQQMSSIHTMAFSAKLQAAKDCFVQNKSILYKALSKIKGHKATV